MIRRLRYAWVPLMAAAMYVVYLRGGSEGVIATGAGLAIGAALGLVVRRRKRRATVQSDA